MEPLEWIALGILMLVTAKCSDGPYGIEQPEPEDWGVVPGTPKPVPTDSYSDDALDVITQPDEDVELPDDNAVVDSDANAVPSDPSGYNTKFIRGLDCVIADLDSYDAGESVLLYGTCAQPSSNGNYTRYFFADASSPMIDSKPNYQTGVGKNVASGSEGGSELFNVGVRGLSVGASGFFADTQTQLFASDDNCVGGIAIMTPDGKHVSTFGPLETYGLGYFPAGEYYPCDANSVLLREGAEGGEVWFPSTLNSATGTVGIVSGCQTLYDMPFDLTRQSCEGEPIIVGPNPSAITELPNFANGELGDVNFAAVQNARGSDSYLADYPTANASIDVVTLDKNLSGFEGLLGVVDLGVGEVFRSKELPLTEDGKTAVAIAEGNLIVVDVDGLNVSSVLMDPELTLESSGATDFVSGVVVRHGLAYVAIKSESGAGKIVTYDISDPSSPSRVAEYPVDDLSGDIEVDGRGVIYAVTRSLDAQSGDYISGVTSIDPVLVI